MQLPATTPPIVSEALSSLVQDLRRRYGARLHRVVLFGSAARGTMGTDSDVDLLVVLDMDEWKAQRELTDVTFPYLMRDGLLISAFSMHPARWAEMARSGRRFAKNVNREGIVLA